MSNETKVGILAVVSTVILIWGYQFLKGKNILSTATTLYVEYQNVQMLQPSANVYINGLRVGVVDDITLKPEDMKTILVSINIDRGINIPKSAKAVIISTGMMGGKAIALEFDGPCTGDGCARNGDYLEGIHQSFLESVVGDPEDIDPYLEKLKTGLNNILDSIADPDADNALSNSVRDIQTILKNLNATTASLNRFIVASSDQMTGILSNMQSITDNIEKGNADIENTLANLSEFSNGLKTAQIDLTMDKANKMLDQTTGAVSNLNKTLEQSEKAVGELTTVIGKMKSGEGTMGKLLSDEELYTNLEKSTRQLELLLQDVRLNPKRYTRILSKKREKYELPEEDPAAKLINEEAKPEVNEQGIN